MTYFVLLIDDGNAKLVMIRDPHAKEPEKPYWKLLGHAGQAHKVRCSLRALASKGSIVYMHRLHTD